MQRVLVVLPTLSQPTREGVAAWKRHAVHRLQVLQGHRPSGRFHAATLRVDAARRRRLRVVAPWVNVTERGRNAAGLSSADPVQCGVALELLDLFASDLVVLNVGRQSSLCLLEASRGEGR